MTGCRVSQVGVWFSPFHMRLKRTNPFGVFQKSMGWPALWPCPCRQARSCGHGQCCCHRPVALRLPHPQPCDHAPKPQGPAPGLWPRPHYAETPTALRLWLWAAWVEHLSCSGSPSIAWHRMALILLFFHIVFGSEADLKECLKLGSFLATGHLSKVLASLCGPFKNMFLRYIDLGYFFKKCLSLLHYFALGVFREPHSLNRAIQHYML